MSTLLFLHSTHQDVKLFFGPEVYDSHKVTDGGGKEKRVSTNIANIINNASCFDNGYTLAVKGRDGRKGKTTIKLTLRCAGRGKHTSSYVSKAKESSTRKSHTMAPNSKEDECPFEIPVYYDTVLKRFYVRQNSGCNFTHHQHPPVARELNRSSTRNLPQDHLDTAVDLLKKHCPTNIVNMVLEALGNNTLSSGSVDTRYAPSNCSTVKVWKREQPINRCDFVTIT